ncbi:hypothetical protein PGT21_009373 [Puccinia graminis f. sp. tritici]|uniref:Uncharacterized protein n=1 Tax=Puccinia graminis f. sp. tritici TaxID=56615 RepID=A0A5B0QMQ4_PUCGR|nr:hypothetical protein PGT21_009373 [Puccinia graminis f. sp. tritici]
MDEVEALIRAVAIVVTTAEINQERRVAAMEKGRRSVVVEVLGIVNRGSEGSSSYSKREKSLGLQQVAIRRHKRKIKGTYMRRLTDLE